MFSLEEISKIKNAQTSKEVMQFFKVLDKYIPDNFQESNGKNKTITHNTTRTDCVEKNNKKEIQDNFPEIQGEYLKV